MKVDGGCHCGHVTYSADIDPETVKVCHCTDCQSSSGSAYRVVAIVPSENFTLLSGKTKTYFKTAESGVKRAQIFCPECGTQLYGTSDEEHPRLLSLRAGTVRQRDQLRPRQQIWRRSALDWVDDLASVQSTDRQGPLFD